MYEPKKSIRKKPFPLSSQSSSRSNSTADSHSVINKSQPGEDTATSRRSRALQYQASLKKLGSAPRPKKSESTKDSCNLKPQNISTKPTLHQAPKQIVAAQEEKTDDGDDADDITFSKLRAVFIDVVESSSTSIETKDELIETIKSQMDAQTIRIRRLERALNEKDDQLIKGDDKDTISLLLTRYPHAMGLFKQQIEQEHYNHQIAICIDQFENQKSQMLEEYQRNFQMLKTKYRSRFDDIVERMISDPSRLDDEWARRVQKDADDRIEEFKRKMISSRSISSSSSSSNNSNNRKVYNHHQ